jgi:hypothetical protein
MAKPDGGPVFPVHERHAVLRETGYGDDWIAVGGMSLRDYFAGKALPQAIARYLAVREARINPGEFDYEEIARAAYVVADAMIAEREKQ